MYIKKYFFVCLLSICLVQPLSAAENIVASETSVQAAFLYNFALYTEWPTFAGTKFNICVMGSEPVYEALQPFREKQVRGHKVAVTKITSVSQADACQILFVGQAEHASIKSISRQLGQEPVLVVAVENSFDPRNVIITLVPQQGRIGFKINNSAAQASSLTISSKLLKLAQQIY